MPNDRENLSKIKQNYRTNSRVFNPKLSILALILAFLLFTSSCQAQNDKDKEAANQRKKQRKQGRKDSRIVRKILTASSNGEHYKVLNLKNFEIKLPFQIPGNKDPIYIRIFHPKESEIKKAYRKQARFVHPDKNSSPDANEAFDALDRATAILLDERLRVEYDLAVREFRDQRGQDRILFLKNTFSTVYGVSAKVSGMGKRILGPFLTPVLVLGALIV